MRSTLKVIYGLLVLLLPIFTVVYLIMHSADFPAMTLSTVDFLERSFFLVVLLNLFFGVMFFAEHDLSSSTLVSLIFGPIIGCVAQYVLVGGSIGLFIAEIGMTYVIELELAFAVLLIIISSAVIVGAIQSRDIGELGGLFAVGIQGLFFIPGIGATIIFGNIILFQLIPQSIPAFEPHWLVGALVYAAWIIPVVQNITAFFWDFKNESIIS